MSSSPTSASPARRRVGRPPLVSRELVIETAARLGPEKLTMTRVAEELGVSTATLYQYVTDRDELLRLAAAERFGRMHSMVDTGQDWKDYLREFVSAMTEALVADNDSLPHLLSVEATLESELRVSEAFYEAFTTRGFTIDEAVEIMAQASVIAIGTAIGLRRDGLSARSNGSVSAGVVTAVDSLGPASLPLVRQAAPIYDNRLAGLETALIEALTDSIDRRRTARKRTGSKR